MTERRLQFLLVESLFRVVAHAEDIGDKLIADLLASKVLENHLLVIVVEGELLGWDLFESEDENITRAYVGGSPIVYKIAILAIDCHCGHMVCGCLHGCESCFVLSALVL